MSLEALTLVRVECVLLSFVMALAGRQTADGVIRGRTCQ